MAFAYQDHHALLLDSACLSKTPTQILLPQQVGEMTNPSSCFPRYYSSEVTPEFSATNYTGACDSSSSLDTSIRTPTVNSHTGYSPLVAQQPRNEKIPKQPALLNQKRKSDHDTSLISGHYSRDAKESKDRKNKRTSRGLKETEDKKPKADDLKASKAFGEHPAGYIHVRARRGQATDSHSLAERVRREKISERMKMLQQLVPGCDKVIGKAHMLDEIINYVQSLQNQVEFLSLKLASMNPMLYDFSMDLDECMNQAEKTVSMSQPEPSTEPSIHLHPTTFSNGATTNYQIIDHSTAPISLHTQGPSSFPQDGGSFVVQVGAQRQGFLNQVEFINMCPFQ